MTAVYTGGEADVSFWHGRRIMLLGHTGFKGAWLGLWLHRLGAKVFGLALPPPTQPSLFELAGLGSLITTRFGDIRDLDVVLDAMRGWQPEIVLHLAAQSLVRESYRQPIATYATNVMGTAHVLEAVRFVASVRAVVIVTSDKCYRNREWPWAYRETEAMGGDDPYSSSKGCAELVVAAYRRSFFTGTTRGIGIATARAGNVIGGGDWAHDRLLPDCIAALLARRPIAVRNPQAVRPWQHVLDPLHGYLLLAQLLYHGTREYSLPWNFGPADIDAQPVEWLVSRIVELWGDGAAWQHDAAPAPLESCWLKVDASRARLALGWAPRLRLQGALGWTVDWHRRLAAGEPARALMDEQLQHYATLAEAVA